MIENRESLKTQSSFVHVQSAGESEDDILKMPAPDGGFKEVFPDSICRKIASCHAGIDEYLVEQIEFNRLEIAIAPVLKNDALVDQITTAVIQSLNSLWDGLGVCKPNYVFTCLDKPLAMVQQRHVVRRICN